MTIESIMSRHVISVSMDASLRDVRELIERHRIHHVVVTDGHRVVGIVSDRDLLTNLSPFVGKPQERTQDSACLNRRVHQIMTRKLVGADPGMSVRDAALTLLEHNISCLPVMNADGGCAGIVTWRDLLRATIGQGADGIGSGGAKAGDQAVAA